MDKIIPQRIGKQEEGLQDLINDLPSKLVMVEIGSYAGESTLLFLKSGKIKKLYSIDPWKHETAVFAEKVFDETTKNYNVVKLKTTIDGALKYLPQEIDFVYIDGDHSYNSVKNDIIKIIPKIKKGGIISGHDYAERYRDRVVKAVNELLRKPDKIYKDTSWIIYL
jgi:predicted O-methyltransferase YrrM